MARRSRSAAAASSVSPTATAEPTLDETAIPAEAAAFARKLRDDGAFDEDGPFGAEKLSSTLAGFEAALDDAMSKTEAEAKSTPAEKEAKAAELAAELEGGSEAEVAIVDLVRQTYAGATKPDLQAVVKQHRGFLDAIRATASEAEQAKRIRPIRRPMGRRASRGCSTRTRGSRRTTTSTRDGPDSDGELPRPRSGADHDRDHVDDRRLHEVGDRR